MMAERAVLYARVSTARQEEQKITSRIAALHKAAAELGLQVPPLHGYVDEGFSSTRLDRPAFDAMPDAAADGLLDVLLVFAPDRLTRNEREARVQAFAAVLPFAEKRRWMPVFACTQCGGPGECSRT